MFRFNDKTRDCLEAISKEFLFMSRNDRDFSKIEFPFMDSMYCLLHNLATIDKPISLMEQYCEDILRGAVSGAELQIKKLENEKIEGTVPLEGSGK